MMKQIGVGLALSCLPVGAMTYVVSPNGNDAAAGTEVAPFQTISRAAEVMKAGDMCLVREGTYRETVTPANSGEEGKPIVFRNWPGERPRIVGSDPVIGWNCVEGDIWRAPITWDLGKNNQVFVNGKPGVEARWPNKTNDDPLDWEAVDYDKGSCNEFLLCSKLPSRPDGYWKGATLWVLAGAKWTSWSTVVTDYSEQEKKILFALPPKQGSIGTHMSPSERRGGFFYLTGIKGEMDTPGEWYLDSEEKMLYVCLEDGQDPNALAVEGKRRKNAFNLSKRQYVQVMGFEVQGAAFAMYDSEHCTVQDVRATWIGHTRGGKTGYSLNEDLGITVTGSHNTIRDSEIAYSAGNGVKLNGRRNALINCWIHHTDYTGSYDAPVKMWGEENLVSHCTIHDTGRDCLQPSGQAHIIEYNNIFNMGRLAHDLGATYVCGSDGGGTEFRYNWCHDNLAHGTRMGIYLDNFTSNYFVYRNLVWNIRGCDIRLNRPSLHNIVVNNTMMGDTGNWGRWKTDWMYACAYVNNAVSGTIKPHPQAAFANNVFHVPAEEINPDHFTAYPVGTGKGLLVPGLNGPNPGIGAYEPGDTWKAGHDFENPPDAEYRLADTPLRNLVQHSSFDWIRWRGKLGPWQPTGAKTAKIIWGPGGIVKCYTERDTIIGAGVALAGDEPDGIEQVVAGFRPGQEYEVGAWVKTTEAATVSISLKLPDVDLASANSADSPEWQRIVARFVAPAKAENATLALTKSGKGSAFIDDVSLVGIIKGMEPRLPGFAPLPPKKVPKPVTVRHKEPVEVRRVVTVPQIDGAVKPGEYSGNLLEVADTPGREPAAGKPCQAVVSHADGVLFIAVTIPLTAPLETVTAPQWTKNDGVEICFAYPDENAHHPTFVLHGFPNGKCESSTEAGASQQAADALLKAVTFAAGTTEAGWTAEWAIPPKAADIEARPGLELWFNIGIFRKESKQWIQWGGTQGQTWRVKRAGKIRLTQ